MPTDTTSTTSDPQAPANASRQRLANAPIAETAPAPAADPAADPAVPTTEPAAELASPTPAPVVDQDAGVGALPEGATELPADSSLNATLDDDDRVLELIYANADGVYYRDNGVWVLADPDSDQPTIDDQEWLDVRPDVIPAYDDLNDQGGEITRDSIADYVVVDV